MAQQENKYLVSWRSLIYGEVDFWEEVQAATPKDAIRIASQGESKEFLELYAAEVEKL